MASPGALFDDPRPLDSLAAYQDGSVVSRELIKRDKGTITVFAFDRGQGLSEHTAPFDAFVHILEGTARILVGEATHTVSRGEAIILPASVPHALRADEPFKMLLVMIRS